MSRLGRLNRSFIAASSSHEGCQVPPLALLPLVLPVERGEGLVDPLPERACRCCTVSGGVVVVQGLAQVVLDEVHPSRPVGLDGRIGRVAAGKSRVSLRRRRAQASRTRGRSHSLSSSRSGAAGGHDTASSTDRDLVDPVQRRSGDPRHPAPGRTPAGRPAGHRTARSTRPRWVRAGARASPTPAGSTRSSARHRRRSEAAGAGCPAASRASQPRHPATPNAISHFIPRMRLLRRRAVARSSSSISLYIVRHHDPRLTRCPQLSYRTGLIFPMIPKISRPGRGHSGRFRCAQSMPVRRSVGLRWDARRSGDDSYGSSRADSCGSSSKPATTAGGSCYNPVRFRAARSVHPFRDMIIRQAGDANSSI